MTSETVAVVLMVALTLTMGGVMVVWVGMGPEGAQAGAATGGARVAFGWAGPDPCLTTIGKQTLTRCQASATGGPPEATAASGLAPNQTLPRNYTR